jgi:basic amino acid/polyamine antiporter, APA family
VGNDAPAPDQWGERLPRRLGPWSAAAVVIGSTIGSGIFRTPAQVAEQIPSLWLFVTVWIVGAIIALCGALTYAELSAMLPRTGGIYVYLRRAFGPLPAFLFGWAELWMLRPAAYGAIAITCAEYGWRLVGRDGDAAMLGPLSGAQTTAAVLIVIVGIVNMRGIQLGAFIQNASTLLKCIAVVALVGMGAAWALGGNEPHSFGLADGPHSFGLADGPHSFGLADGPVTVAAIVAPPSTIGAFGLAMVAVLWAYDGWSDVGFVSGEVKDPQRNLPRAFFRGTLAVAVLYLSVLAAYLAVISLPAMPGSKLIASDVAVRVVGAGGASFVAAAVVVSTFGTLNGSMMTGPRIFYAMAEDGLFFRALARIHPLWRTPSRAIGLSIGLGVAFVSMRGFAELTDQFVVGIWPFYALGVLAVFVLRAREPDYARPYRTWGYPFVPAAFLVATVFLLGTYAVTKPIEFGFCIAVIAAGVPVWLLWSRRARP